MRRLTSKIIGIIVLTMLLINSNFMLIISTALDTIENQENNEITQEPNATASLELEKYCNYSLNDEEEKGVLVQVNLKTGIDFPKAEEYKPLKSTEVILSSPKIEENYPQKVIVLGKSTKATNGKESGIEPNYQYNQENGELIIYTTNEADEDGNIYNNNDENACDEYKIIYYYDENSYNNENVERNIEINANVKETLYDDSNLEVETQCNLQQYVTENVGGLVSTRIQTSEIYNGYIYSNAQNGTNEQTTYLENTEIDISYEKVADETIIATEDNFIDSSENIINTDEIVYKTTRFSKLEVLDILGEDGKIEILNENDEIVAEIDKDSPVSESGIVEVDYGEGITELKIKITKPLKIGSIHLQNKKAIKETMLNDNYKGIQTSQNVVLRNIINKDNEAEQEAEEKLEIVEEQESEGKLEIKEEQEVQEIARAYISNFAEIKNAETNIDVKIDKTELTNKIQNDVNITATLKTNSMKYNLFRNPIILLTFPNEVEEIILGDVSLLYDNNLSIKSAEVVDNNGAKAIKIELDGTQNSYNQDSMIYGANVIIPATVILNKEFESTKGNISVMYANETATGIDYNNEGKDSKQIEVSLESIIKKPQIEESEFGPTMQVVSYSQDENMDNNAGIATISETGDVISETGDAVEETGLKVETVAKVGDKVLSDGDSVHEDEIIKYIIRVTNTTDDSIDNVKVVGNVPEGTTYAIMQEQEENNYDDNQMLQDELYKYDDSITEYEKTIDSIKENQTVQLYYEVKVNNIEEDTEEKTIKCDLNVYVNKTKTYNTTFNNIIKKGEICARLYSLSCKGENRWIYQLWVYNTTDIEKSNIIISSQIPEEFEYKDISIGYSDKEAKEDNSNINIDNNKLSINTEKIEEKGFMRIYIEVQQKTYKSNVYEYDLNLNLTVTDSKNAEVYYSNEYTNKGYSYGVKIIQTSETEGKNIKFGDEIEYNFVIDTVGKNITEKAIAIQIQDYLPKELDLIEVEYDLWELDEEEGKYVKKVDKNTTLQDDGLINTYLYLPEGEKINIKIKAKVNGNIDDVEIENSMTVSGNGNLNYNDIGTVISNTIKNKILSIDHSEEIENEEEDENIPNNDNNNNNESSNNSNNPSNSNNNSQTDDKTYSIKGLVWQDLNKDGKRDSGESLINNINVELYDIESNVIAKDKDGNSAKTITNQNGEYQFNNIRNGKYIVLFKYDTSNYNLTTYQKENVSDTLNSDVVKKDIAINGVESTVAVTDTITIDGQNILNIDMGLIKKQIFDFSLQKYVSKITVNDGKKQKEYNYNNSKLAKIEISAKTLKSTKLYIEYKIVVKNEGEVEGYITELVDYIPEDLTFETELNQDWSKNTDGSLKNTGLSKTKIFPGEEKEIKIILTKNMTEDSTGTITNVAEIGKTNNSNNLKDIDSTENNKNQKEDDYSEAEVIISVSTGIVKFTLLVFIILIILILLRKIIITKKIKLRHFMSFIIFTILIGAIIIPNVNGVMANKDDTDSDPKFYTGSIKDLENSIKRYYETSSTVTVNFSKNFVRHYTSAGSYVNKNIYHCISPGLKMDSYDHPYTQYNVEVSIGSSVILKAENEIKNVGSTPKLKLSERGVNILGPYKIKFTRKKGNMTSYANVVECTGKSIIDNKTQDILGRINIIDKNGNPLMVVGNNDAFAVPFNEEFYISVPKDIYKVNNIKLEIDKVKKWITWYTYTAKEYWKPKTPLGCEYSNESHQNVEVEWKKDLSSLPKDFNDYDALDNSGKYFESQQLNLEGAQLPTGSLEIEKRDGITWESLDGAVVHISGPIRNDHNYGCVDDDFVIKGGKKEIKHLPIGEYEIREIRSPYTLEYQAKEEKLKIANVDENVMTPVKIDNISYGNLKIIKIDKETKQPMKAEGIKFKITKYDPYKKIRANNGSGFVSIDDSCIVEVIEKTTDANGEIYLEKTETKYWYRIEEIGFEEGCKYEPYYEAEYEKLIKGLRRRWRNNNN